LVGLAIAGRALVLVRARFAARSLVVIAPVIVVLAIDAARAIRGQRAAVVRIGAAFCITVARRVGIIGRARRRKTSGSAESGESGQNEEKPASPNGL
jgi:hypothetical protein